MVAVAVARLGIREAAVLDIACGTGQLYPYLRPFAAAYDGADLVRYPDLPPEVGFMEVDGNTGRVPRPDGTYDVVVSVETIEHLENPRAFTRELTRLCRPGGWVLITTPNQLSLLSKLTLVFKNHFTFFGKDWYPAHLSALLEVDLRRIAAECGLTDVRVVYGNPGRVVLTPRTYPKTLVRAFPRACSDNVMVVGRKEGG
jgi:SAM-dependent methyltransferase